MMKLKKGKAKPMFRLYEEGSSKELLYEVPYFKDATKTCGQCEFLNEFEFCENIGLGFDETINLGTFRACEAFIQREASSDEK